MQPYRTAYIYVGDLFAGTLEETDSGYTFSYAPEYLSREGAGPVSITLPLRPEPYCSGVLFPFFDGLIPEGWLLDVVTHNWKLDQNDRFGLLLAVCRDCIGNVSIREVRE